MAIDYLSAVCMLGAQMQRSLERSLSVVSEEQMQRSLKRFHNWEPGQCLKNNKLNVWNGNKADMKQKRIAKSLWDLVR